MARIHDDYERLTGHREPYLAQAQFNARYTIDVGIFEEVRAEYNDMGNDQIDSDYLMSTSIHKTLVRNLAATQTSVLFPVRVPWVLLNIKWDEKTRKDSTAIKKQLSDGQLDILQRFDAMGVRSAFYSAAEHGAVAGQCIMHFRDKDKQGRARVRLFGLRQFVVERQDQVLKRLIICESEEELTTEGSKTKKRWYTEVDYVAGVVRQEIDEEIKDIPQGEDNPKRWVLVQNEPPKPGRHYCNAFVTNHIHTIIELDTLHRAYQDLVGEAAFMVIWTHPSAGISPDDRAKLEKLGGPVCIQLRGEGMMGIITAQQKLADAAMVHQRILEVEQQLRKDFLHGLLEARGQIKTATHVREIVAEMESIGAQFYAYHQDHTLLPIAEALMDMDGLEIEYADAKITPTILTGVSALTQQEEAEALLNILVQIGQIWPEDVQKLPFLKIFKRLASPYHIETEDLTADELDIMDLLKQLAMKVQEDPEHALPLIKAVVGQIPGMNQPEGQPGEAAPEAQEA